MTIIEFFDSEPIHNMVSCLANHPKKIVFLGDGKTMTKSKQAYETFLQKIGYSSTMLEYKSVPRLDLSEIVKVLEQVLEENEDCALDLTGGDDLAMVASGIIYEKHRKEGLQLHRYNIRTGKVYDCDLDGTVVSGNIPPLSVKDSIRLHGGCVVEEKDELQGREEWDFNQDFSNDIANLWEICKGNCGLWNFQINLLNEIRGMSVETNDELSVRTSIRDIREHCKQQHLVMNPRGIYRELAEKGLLVNVRFADEEISFSYKNEQVKRCLDKGGTILELKTCVLAMQALNKDGTRRYDDVMTGVRIDWDGITHKDDAEEVDTENEIDVIMMDGLIPVFVSCKTGEVDADELYKLQTVANRFGGKYVKKVLVMTKLRNQEEANRYLLQRAKDMGIHVVQDVHLLSDGEFLRAVRNFSVM